MLSSKSRRRLPPLHALRAFEATARHRSVKKAAAELAVTPTAVSHHVRVLEDALGVKLFERHPRRLELTAYGRDLYPVLREGFGKFADAIDRLKTKKLRTVVTLSATVAFTARWLAPRVPAFHRDHPNMDLRLHASDEVVDLRSGVADAAIRYGRGDYAGHAAETLFEDAYAPVCSPRLRVRDASDLAKHTMIHFEWRKRRSEEHTSELQSRENLVCRLPWRSTLFPYTTLFRSSDEVVDLRSGVADAAIRYGRGDYAGHAAETLFEDAYAPVCSPRLRVRDASDLAKHTMIHFEWRKR